METPAAALLPAMTTAEKSRQYSFSVNLFDMFEI
jgi:hypothetical protein